MNGQIPTPYVIAIGVLIVVVVAAGVVLLVLRSRMLGDREADLGSGGILETMRAMRERGEISEEEYRTAQSALVAKATAPRGENSGADHAPRQSPARDRTRPVLPGEIRAKPGFDLTGAPLPPPVPDEGDHGGDSPRRV